MADPLRVAARTAALSCLAVLVAVGVGLWSFGHDQRVVVIGAHTTTVRPTFDGYATLDLGPLVPQLRVPADQPLGLGVALDVGATSASNVNQLIARDAAIAAQAGGEVAKVRATVRSMALESALRGAGAGLLAVVAAAAAWAALGPARRRDLRSAVGTRLTRPWRAPSARTLAAGVGVCAGAALLVAAHADREESAVEEGRWEPLHVAFPELPADPLLDRLEVSSGGATAVSRSIVDSAISTYRTSVRFYGDLTRAVRTAAPLLRKPASGETVALLVSDRHDNIGMDPVIGAVARAGGATVLIDAGDDTSSGGAWEAFSINSLAREFKGFDAVAIAGNHDNGPFVRGRLTHEGFTLLTGERTDVAGITFLGDSDPRSSSVTTRYARGRETVAQQDARLTAVACKGARVSTVVVHSPASATALAASGCVDLVLSGHLHRQVGPTTIVAPNGRRTVTYTNSTTGGAVYAFALGSKLRRPAEVTLVTYADGRPVGLQPVGFDTGGAVSASAYVPLVVGPLS